MFGRGRSIAALFMALLGALVWPSMARAEHPIDVQQKASDGDYLGALLAFDRMPKRIATTESVIAAGKSAWALGLADRARKEFESAIQDESLSIEQRAKLFLSRGVIELQENRSKTAVLYAEKAATLLTEVSPLKARVFLLWGDALRNDQSYGGASAKYSEALSAASTDDIPDIHFRLGECALKIGKADEAQANFEQIPLVHERAPQAIRYLAQIALDAKQFESAQFWLGKGRENFPDQFLDSWVDFALVQSAVNQGDQQRVRALQTDAAQKYPPSDAWLNLLNAEAEEFYWKVSKS